MYSDYIFFLLPQVRFVWPDRHSEEENLINLVVERNTEMPNLVYLRYVNSRSVSQNANSRKLQECFYLQNAFFQWCFSAAAPQQ